MCLLFLSLNFCSSINLNLCQFFFNIIAFFTNYLFFQKCWIFINFQSMFLFCFFHWIWFVTKFWTSVDFSNHVSLLLRSGIQFAHCNSKKIRERIIVPIRWQRPFKDRPPIFECMQMFEWMFKFVKQLLNQHFWIILVKSHL